MAWDLSKPSCGVSEPGDETAAYNPNKLQEMLVILACGPHLVEAKGMGLKKGSCMHSVYRRASLSPFILKEK